MGKAKQRVREETMIKVLIVDDEYIMRQGLKYMFNWEQEGYEIVGEATNGAEALKLIEELKPHIIICDIVMPILNGVDFAEAVHRMHPQIQTIILSGYDNFEYVKHTLMNGVVDYILKPTLNQEELRKVLKKAAERIPGYKLSGDTGMVSYERLLERYLLGHDKELDVCQFSQYFTAPYFRIYALNRNKQNDKGQDMAEVLYKKLERELQNIKNVQKLVITIREGLVCVIFCFELSQEKKLLNRIADINEQLVLLCPYILGVVSRNFSDFALLYTVYQQDVLKNVDKAFYFEETKLLIAGQQEPEEQVPISKFDFFRYNQMLNNKQYVDAVRMLSDYNQAALEGQMDVFRLKNQMKNMIYHFLDCLQISDQEREDHRYRFFHEINQAMYEKSYCSCIHNIMMTLQELSGQSGTQTNERIEKMLVYIARNYQEDLKLEDLASEFNFNYHYLSAYFSQQMQEGFSDYLNRVRIEKACRLLQESNKSIAQISSEVGYAEHSYFCRVFKKVTGETPSEWRRSKTR